MGNLIHDNLGQGISIDNQCYDIKILKNSITNNRGCGIQVIYTDYYAFDPNQNITTIMQ
ncbi:unnamed protein product, partial [marine sediment metagenome]